MKRRASVLVAALAVASSTPSAVGHHLEKQPTFKKHSFAERVYPHLYVKAKKSKRVNAGRDVLRHGRREDGKFSHNLVRKEVVRLWIALHPANTREHARRARSVWYVPDGPIKAHLLRILSCESGGRYHINTGNGFSGGFQFMDSTWQAVGGSGSAHQASPEEQLYRAYLLYQRSGPGQWPVCSQR